MLELRRFALVNGCIDKSAFNPRVIFSGKYIARNKIARNKIHYQRNVRLLKIQ